MKKILVILIFFQLISCNYINATNVGDIFLNRLNDDFPERKVDLRQWNATAENFLNQIENKYNVDTPKVYLRHSSRNDYLSDDQYELMNKTTTSFVYNLIQFSE